MKKKLLFWVLAAVLVAAPAGARETEKEPSILDRLWQVVVAFILPGEKPPEQVPAGPVPPQPPPCTPGGGGGDGGPSMDPHG